MKRHIFTLNSRWGDIDGFGHVNNAVYLTYIQEARVDFTWFSRKSLGQKPLFLDMVVARTEVDYIVPIYDGHAQLEIAVWISRIGNSSFTMKFEVTGDGVTYAKATTVQVTVNMETKRSRPLTEEERAFLLEYQEDSE